MESIQLQPRYNIPVPFIYITGTVPLSSKQTTSFFKTLLILNKINTRINLRNLWQKIIALEKILKKLQNDLTYVDIERYTLLELLYSSTHT